METGTLRQELEQQPADAIHRVHRKLLIIQMLACVQCNLMDEIKAILEEQKKYRYELKHNMKQIRELCFRNIRNESFFGSMSQDTMDNYMDDFERLEKMISDFENED